jgi:hypothetical protein
LATIRQVAKMNTLPTCAIQKVAKKFELLHFSKMCPKFRLAQYIGDHSPNVKNESITYLRHVEN